MTTPEFPRLNSDIPWPTRVTPGNLARITMFRQEGNSLPTSIALFVQEEERQIAVGALRTAIRVGKELDQRLLQSVPYYSRVAQVLLDAEKFNATGRHRVLEMFEDELEDTETIARTAQGEEISFEEVKGELERDALITEMSLEMFFGRVGRFIEEGKVPEAVNLIAQRELNLLSHPSHEQDREVVRFGHRRLLQLYEAAK